MATDGARDGQRARFWRIAGWGIAAALMLLPLAAMQFTEELNWTAFDFLFMGVLLGSVGLGFEWIVRKSGGLAYRAGAAIALLAAFLTIWVNAAVGMIGTEDNSFNLLFGIVLLIAFIGAIAARFEPSGMTRTMTVAALVQAVLSAIGWFGDERGGVFSMGFTALWLIAAVLFRHAARDRQSAGRASPA